MLPQEVLSKQTELLDYVKSLSIPVQDIQDMSLFLQVFVHKSYAADYKKITAHNERLEFLWDWVLWAITNKLLFINYPDNDESDLTLYKIAIVREETLADVARDIGLDKYIFISKWEQKMEWRNKNSILSDCLESLIWFLYIDLWIDVTEKFVNTYIYSKISKIAKDPIKSYKTMLQETIQKEFKELPIYKDSENKVDDKANVLEYKSEIFVSWEKTSEGFGTNKKKAQEDAAKNYYENIKPNDK